MRKLLLTQVLTALALSTVFAQVHIQATIPVVGLVQKNQLWNLVLVNGTAMTIDGRLEIVLRDRQNGIELFTATTSRISLPKGSLSVNVNSLNPIQYNYVGMEPDKTISGLLPAGAYIVCYSFSRTSGEKQELLAEECFPFDAEPLSPPMLMFPADSSELETQPMQFSWTPPAPAGMFNKLHYEFFITEIMPGQKAAEALQVNMSFYNTSHLYNNFLTYPAGLPAFEKEKWYAWQVVARSGENYAAKTETWVFKIKNPEQKPPVPENLTYLLLHDDLTGTYTIAPGKLRIKYSSADPEHETQVSFFDEKGNMQARVSRKIRQGDNYLDFDLGRNFHEGSSYKVMITDQSGKNHSLIFSIIKN